MRESDKDNAVLSTCVYLCVTLMHIFLTISLIVETESPPASQSRLKPAILLPLRYGVWFIPSLFRKQK